MNLRHLCIPALLALAACGGKSSSSSSSSGGSTTSTTTSSGSTSSTTTSTTSSGSTSSTSSGSSGSTGSSSSSSSSSSGSSGSSGTTGQGAPLITGVSVDGATAAQIRQGATGTVHLTGVNLQNASSVQLGSTPLTITSDNATEIIVTVTVPHGAATGSQDISVTTPGGSSTDLGALEITDIAVSPAGADSAAGVPSSPFGTISHALSVAGNGDTVLLLPGTYDPSVETFPSSATPAGYTCNAPGGVLITGATDAGANPLIAAATDAGNAVPFVNCGDFDLSNVDLQGFVYGLVALQTGSVKLANVHQSAALNDGLYASGTGVVVSISSPTGLNLRTAFDQNGGSGIHLLNQATLIANKLDARQNAIDGILAEDAQSCSLQFTKLDNNLGAGLFATGGTQLALGPTVEASGNESGIVLNNLARAASLTGILAESNAADGVAVLGNSKGLTLSDQFIDANAVGLHIDTSPDAGTQVSVQNLSGNVAGLVANGRGLLVNGGPQSVVLNALNTGAITIQNNFVNLDVSVLPGTLVSVRGAIFNGGDGGAAYPDAFPSGGERIPWIVDGGAADGGDLVFIDSSGITQLPLEWDPDAGEGPFNYLLHADGGQIQF